MFYTCSEESVFDTVERIDKIAEVAQLLIPPLSTHRTSVLGACTPGFKEEDEKYRQTSQDVPQPLYTPHII